MPPYLFLESLKTPIFIYTETHYSHVKNQRRREFFKQQDRGDSPSMKNYHYSISGFVSRNLEGEKSDMI